MLPASARYSTAVLLAVLPASLASSQTAWTAADGDWSNEANWTAGQPFVFDTTVADPDGDPTTDDGFTFSTAIGATIDNAGTVRVTQAGEVADVVQLGATAGGSGTLIVSTGGELTVNADDVAAQGLYLGDTVAGSSGRLVIDGGTVNILSGGGTESDGTASSGAGGDLTVGRAGSGSFEFSAGELNVGSRVNANIIIANRVGSSGTVTQTGGDAKVAGSVFIGANGPGDYSISGGTLDLFTDSQDIFVSNGATGVGVFNVSDTAVVTVGDNLRLADDFGGSGVVNQTGGSQAYGNSLLIGNNGDGTFNLSGGSLAADSAFVGNNDNAVGDFVISGGTLTVTNNFAVAATSNFNLAATTANTGRLAVVGSDATIAIGGFFVADTDRATLAFDVDGGGISLVDVASDAFLSQATVDMGVAAGATPSLGDAFDLLTASSIDALPTLLAADASAWSLDLVSGGNGQVLRATYLIPEPASAAVLAAGALLLASRRRVAG
ncbi:PEP-CTERM domain protein [Phycisphaera mikurensis]|nr:PEP-CTERM domain protein [Phycisphaera mikurensis]MBB6441963.1 hypothetical protein [Phycisphaera mikurensis]